MSGIVIENVRKSFDTKDGVVEALRDVNLSIDSGEDRKSTRLNSSH